MSGAPGPEFLKLKRFIESQMRMSHIYQPVMLMELLRSGGSSTVEDIARAISAHDPSQTEYYSEVTKSMVGPVLANHGIVFREENGRRTAGFKLQGIEDLSEVEIAELIELCQAKLT